MVDDLKMASGRERSKLSRPEPRRDFFLSLAFAAQRGGSKMLREAGKRRRDRRALDACAQFAR